MKFSAHKVFLCLAAVCLFSLTMEAVDVKDTRLLGNPAVCADQIAFVYAGDLWAADRDGNRVRRLTSDEGIESDPVFSPDGSLVAFSAQYDGNTDVYLIPAGGGIPRRLTWHPGSDRVRGFTPDGRAVLFISGRSVFTNRYTQLFTVPVSGGFPTRLDIPNAFRASYSPDGRRLAYTPISEPFNQWKRYRGGTHTVIWLYTFKDHSVEKILQPEGRCNDTDPMWIGDKIYFRSDRNGEFNLFSYATDTKKIEPLTGHEDFPILSAGAGAGSIIYEQAGYLHLFDPVSRRSKKLTVGVAGDLQELRPRFVEGANYIRHAHISPSGARVVFGTRGEIITMPAEKGDPRYLTNTPGLHERYPVWSPDGRWIAFFSDESGEYGLHVMDQSGKGEVKKFAVNGAGFYDRPVWSPDSKKIVFTDNSWSLFWIDLESGRVRKIASEYQYGPRKTLRGDWSPDSMWIAYTLNTATYMQKVFLYSLEKDKSFPVTDGLSEVSEPVFDESGKYLYFLASTDAGPVKHWFAMSSADMKMTSSIYLAVLPKGEVSPLAKESDEEKGEKPDKKPEEKKPEKEEGVTIDLEGIQFRIIDLPISPGSYMGLQAGKAGEIYFVESSTGYMGFSQGGMTLHHFSLKTRKDDVLGSGILEYAVSADRGKLLYRGRNLWAVVPAGGKIDPGKGRLDTSAIRIKIDPAVEWPQIYDEAWRINRDYFYDPDMHGVDWEAEKKKYEVFLPHLACRSDLNRVIQWLCSELSVGHHRVGGGDQLQRPDRVPGGLLGADYSIENGRYRFKKIFGGLNWNPNLRSPLTEPGVDVKEGWYLLAVNGRDLKAPDNLFARFEYTAGKIVELTVGPNPDGSDSRTVQAVPTASEYALRNRDWVEGNLKRVEEATNGRVAYAYVPNTAGLGHVYFKRYFFPQSDREAIIVDERFNGGGQVADYYIDLLRRPYISHWATRYGADLKTPSASIQGPKVMLIDETAGSGGDLLPWMFRKLKIGPLIGKRTWGGLVGTLGFPVLMDGGGVTAPNLGIWTEDGFVVENVGVPPDIEVEQWPAEVIMGRDPQLEKAIEVILDMLEKNPPKKYKRPPFPKR
jgi:tricorn protease